MDKNWRRYEYLKKYVVLFLFQILFLEYLKITYPSQGGTELIRMELTGANSSNHIYLFSVGVLLLFLGMELYVVFQPIRSFFKRYDYLYGRISANNKKKMAQFLSADILRKACCCILIHIISTLAICCVEIMQKNFHEIDMKYSGNSAEYLRTVWFYPEIFHLVTLLFWGGFMVMLFYLRLREKYIWMIVCLVLCIGAFIQSSSIIVPFIPFNPYLLWQEQAVWKIAAVLLILCLQYILVVKCKYYSVESGNKEG